MENYSQINTFPRFLDPLAEKKIVLSTQNKKFSDVSKEFILNSFRTLYKMNRFSDKQVLQLTALMFNISNGGRVAAANNYARWLITETFVNNYKTTHGGKSPYFYCVDSKQTGKKYFRAFNTLDEFYTEWTSVHLPKQTYMGSTFENVGKSFWSGSGSWLQEFITASNNNKLNFESLNRSYESVQSIFVQHSLGATKETLNEKLMEFQKSKNIMEPTNSMTDEVYKMITAKWKEKGMK